MRAEQRLLPALPILALILTTSQVRSDTPPQASSEKQQVSPPTIQYPSHVSAGHSAPPAGVLSNPYKGDRDMAAAGAGLFSSMNCDGCHGGGASGFAAPSLADGRWRYGGSEQEIFQSIFYGRPKGMPAFGGALGPDGIWILVTYLKSLPVPDNLPTQSWESVASVAAVAPPPVAAAPAAPVTPQPVAAPAAAGATANAEGLLKQHACLACHSTDVKVVGPSYRDVAAKYRGQKDAEQALVAKVKYGGMGVWGEMPMPPNGAVPDADLHAMIKWILALD